MNISIVSLGCPKNLVDSEVMLGIINSSKHNFVYDYEQADAVIINTCGFINDAKEESINTIFEFVNMKNEGKIKYIIVAGCLSERYTDEIIELIPEVDAVLGTTEYGHILDAIDLVEANNGMCVMKSELTGFEWLELDRVVTTNTGMAYLKLAEGCDNHCTYCIIPKLRGKFRSRTIEQIYNEAVRLVEGGVTELVLVAQNTAYYGTDIYGELKLVELIIKLSSIKNLRWIRLLYCYPELVTDELIAEIRDNEKVCHYIDMPIQHAADPVLKRMGRRTTKHDMEILIEKLRKEIPDIALRTTVMVGFPGETDDDFEQLIDFIKTSRFDNLGAFIFSKEENTPAYNLIPEIDEKIAEKRYNDVMLCQQEIVAEKISDMLGTVVDVVVEGIADDGIFYFGRSAFQAPDIDSITYFTSEEELKAGQHVMVEILNNQQYDLIGAVKYELT